MIVGIPKHKAKFDERYDAIVIGSGMGGLTTAACLAKCGQKVLVLEQHYTAGGFTHTYARKGYEWDVGVHYIGEVHRPHSVLRRIFDYISDGKLQWAQMGDVYDRIYLGDESFDFVSGIKPLRKKLLSYFPDEGPAIDKYFKLVGAVNRSASWFFLEKALPNWLTRILNKPLCRSYLDFADQTTESVLLKLTQNKKLIAVLTGQWGDYGVPPKESSFAMHAMVAKHYFSGAAYPVGGSSSIAKTIEPVIKQAGGQIVTRSEVEQIIVEADQAVGVRLAGGQEIRAGAVISSAGVFNTWRDLLTEDLAQKHGFTGKLQRVNPSMAHVGVYIGLKGSSKDLGLDTTNLWIYRDQNHDANIRSFYDDPDQDFPVVYISFPSSKDPEWDSKFPGKSTIEIVAPAPYAWFKQWEGSAWQKRGKDYDDFKARLQERLLQTLYRIHPQLVGKIHFAELSTPLSTAHFSRYKAGEIYGIDHKPSRFREQWLRTDTPIRNLYMTGQDIVTCGVGGALCAGVLTTIRILGPWKGLHLINILRPQRPKQRAAG